MTEEDVRDLFAPILAVATRRMFGGIGVYDGGRMFALVADGELHLKTDGENRAEFEAAGSLPFTHESGGKAVVTSYWRLPEAAFDDEEALQRWTGLARAAAERAARSKTPRRTPGRSAPGKNVPKSPRQSSS